MDKVQLELNKLKTSYGKFSVSNVSFELNSGDIMGLVGRSGAGKSTLIKTLVGQKKQDEGTIKVKINNIDNYINENIGYAPQENALYSFLTLEENLKIFGRLQKVDGKVIETRAKYILNRLDLKQCKNKKIIQLSGGMQKRADLAVTLIHDPKIIILDEPFNGLDISLQKFIWEFIQDLAKEGKIIIISSHMLKEIQIYCNKIGLIEKGFFYNTSQIMQNMASNKQRSIYSFLEALFKRERIKK